MVIDSFRDEFRFLSNFYPAQVVFEGVKYPSTEHAFQATKTLDLDARRAFEEGTAAEAKRLGRSVKLREDWDAVKDRVMMTVLLDKFKPGGFMAQCLDATGDDELIEGNWWGDTYWGVCKGVGQNKLGRMLMVIRARNRESLAACK